MTNDPLNLRSWDMPSTTDESLPQNRNALRLAGISGRKVLVTGGAGFVGSMLAARLCELGAIVTVLDDLSTGRRELLPSAISSFVEGSVTDLSLLQQVVSEQSYVFHLAVRNIILSTQEPRADCDVNIGGTLNVLMAARQARGLQRVVYASSVSVYGNAKRLPIVEEDGIDILSPYAASKFAGESYARAFFEMFDLPIAIVRYSNVYGKHQSPDNPYCGVVSKFFDACLTGSDLLIHGGGLQTRDFTYISDVVEATLLAAVAPRAEGEVINIGSGQEITIRALAQMITELAKFGGAVRFIDRRDIDNVNRRVVSIEKARRLLRWTPQTALSEGLSATYEWLSSVRARG